MQLILKEREDVQPLCPHCSRPLDQVFFRELKGFAGKRYIYFCPHCNKALGVTHRKGFWMG